MREVPTVFRCHSDMLVGVLSMPATPADMGVLIVVGGPQYRVGSHRQFVHIARALCAAGLPTLRFDARGMGDSSGAARGFELLSDDIGAAIDTLVATAPTVRHVTLLGLCDGASASLLYLHEVGDTRVAAMCLLNPWVRSAEGLARTRVRHYYIQRLAQREFWAKLFGGKVASSAAFELFRAMRTALGNTGARASSKQSTKALPFQDRMGLAWQQNSTPILLVLSDDDYTAKEFLDHVRRDAVWRDALTRQGVSCLHLQDADHTLSGVVAQAAFERGLVRWLKSLPIDQGPNS